MVMWTIKEYKKWISSGCPIDLTVTELDISGSNIKSLNRIQNLTNLVTLIFHDNQLTSLNGIENLTNLVTFISSRNQLTSLNGIENLT